VEEFARQGLHGALFIPVVGSGRVYGVLELFRRERLKEREEDEALASALGHQFGRFLDRLHNEQAEHTRDEALRQLWDSDLLGLFTSDPRGQVLDANPCLLRMLGYTRQDLREGRLSWSVLLPTHPHVTSGALPRRLQTADTYQSFEGELLRKHHGTLPALLGSAGLGEGRVVTYVLDLSDWKPGELAPHQQAEARLHTLLSHVPVVLFALDGEGVFTLSEGHGLEQLGLKPGQVVGLSVFDLYRTEPAVLAHARRALEGEEFVSVEALTNGLVFETHWTPLSDAEGHPTGTLALSLDVTQREHEARLRSQLLAEAERAREEAELAVRTRDDFLTIASHELKTPLTSLQLQLHALLKRAREGTRPEEPSQVERLDKAQRQVRKVARMMDELLDVTQVTSGRPRLELREVDLTLLVREVLERLHEEAQRAETRLELRDGAPVLGRWDRAKLEQVVTNLVSNAMKYGAGAPVEVVVHSSGSMAMLEVTDHGIGIAPENLERIFGKFERAVSVRKYGGFGLGLYIVRQLVEAMGGAVDVESVSGEGSTFRVVLPLAGPELRPTPTSPSEAGLH
jgi:PAS domain S-box-containing protein